MSIIINILKIIILLGLLVFIHEGGHCIAAKKLGVVVKEFSIGFGKKIFSKKINGTIYSLSLIPIGGYCQMLGEDDKNNIEKGSFNAAKPIVRIIICLAGPLINIIFALIIYFILAFCTGNNISTTVASLTDTAINMNTPIQVGDTILEINNQKIRLKSDIIKIVSKSQGNNVSVLVERNNEKVLLEVTPYKYENQDDYYVLGIEVKLADNSLNNRLYYSFWETIDFFNGIPETFAKIFTLQVSINEFTGPVGISQMVASSDGISEYIYLLSVISLSLGVSNLLPIPALDGGRIVIYCVEMITKKKLDEKIESELISFGFSIIICLSIYITFNDIIRLF